MEINKRLLPIDANSLLVEAPSIPQLALLFGINAIQAEGHTRCQGGAVVRQELLGFCAVVGCEQHLRQRERRKNVHGAWNIMNMLFVRLWSLH